MEQRNSPSALSTSSTSISIRAYQPDDLEVIVQLWYRTWHQTFPHLQHPYPYAAWEERFREYFAVHGSIWLAEIDPCIAGFIVIIPDRQWIDQLFVDANYQSRGVGAALLKQAKAICSEGLSLCTLQENVRARSFYERHGFKAGKSSINPFNRQPNIEYCWIP